jgi:hypothetical protein
MNVPLDQLKDRTCDKCGGLVFTTALLLKELPALYSPAGVLDTAILQAGFVCVQCGNVISRLPVPAEKEESKILLAKG